MPFDKKMLLVDYTNHAGERRKRPLVPSAIQFNMTQWHREEQWLVFGIDPEDLKLKSFALSGFHGFEKFRP
jgi:hypothetical protein